MSDQPSPEIIDYEGYDYRKEFWADKGRDYEDRVERIAIKRLLPPIGDRLVDVGGGFGRLLPLYAGYRQVVLFDYSRSQLEFARQQYGDEGYLYVAGNIYQMPFAPALFDTVVMVRVLHHMEDAPTALQNLRTISRSDGTFLLEFANKQNLKAIARWLFRRQDWNPFSLEPVEFVELHYDFHPRYVRQTLDQVGFKPDRALTVSHFRVNLLKKLIPTGLLVAMDSAAQYTGRWWQLSPSVFIRSMASGPNPATPEGIFWRCPSCGSLDMQESLEVLVCDKGHRWAIVNGIYDFKEPV
jgi:ubiquinone/menaquinone biosynthesis C-methylase UbiE